MKQARKEREGPAFLRYDVTGPVMPGSLRKGAKLPSISRSNSQPAVPRVGSAPASSGTSRPQIESEGLRSSRSEALIAVGSMAVTAPAALSQGRTLLLEPPPRPVAPSLPTSAAGATLHKKE